MESAGKRIIRDPKCYTDYIVESHKPKMSTTTITTIITTSIPTSSFPSSNINTMVNQQPSGSSNILFRQMMEDNRKRHVESKVKLCQHTTDLVAKCMQVWRLAAVHLSKLEDKNLHQVLMNSKQETPDLPLWFSTPRARQWVGITPDNASSIITCTPPLFPSDMNEAVPTTENSHFCLQSVIQCFTRFWCIRMSHFWSSTCKY